MALAPYFVYKATAKATCKLVKEKHPLEGSKQTDRGTE